MSRAFWKIEATACHLGGGPDTGGLSDLGSLLFNYLSEQSNRCFIAPAFTNAVMAASGPSSILVGTDSNPAFNPLTRTSESEKVKVTGTNFRSRQRAGEIIVTPLSKIKIVADYRPAANATSADYMPYYMRAQWAFYGSTSDPQHTPRLPFPNPKGRNSAIYVVWRQCYGYTYLSGPPLWFSNMPQKAETWYGVNSNYTVPDVGVVTATLADANNGTYDLLTELAELPETLGYFNNVLKQMHDATVAARDKEIKWRAMYYKKLITAAKLTEAIASVWLQYRYAIKPLVYSIEDIQQTLFAYKRKYARFNDRSLVPVSYADYEGWTRLGSEATMTHRCMIKRAYDPGTLAEMLAGVMNVNPFLTAYELIPLSFVTDWAWNMNELISAITGYKAHIQEGSTYSWKLESSVTYQHIPSGSTIVFNYNCYNRLPINPLSHIGLKFDIDMNVSRYLDAIALSLSALLPLLRKNLK